MCSAALQLEEGTTTVQQHHDGDGDGDRGGGGGGGGGGMVSLRFSES